jgi:PKD repeat protein
MITSLHIVRKALTWAIFLIVLAIELTLFGMGAAAQNYGTGMASAPHCAATANAMSFGMYNTPICGTYSSPNFGTYEMPTPPIGTGIPSQAAPNASLLAVPVFGRAPLTVNFHVGLANTPGSLVDGWVFGDGAESFLPAQPYMLHVYQHPGTYTCELELITPIGVTTTVFATITVKPVVGKNGS